jgi:peptidoglycan/xylan/chitin deacetylase (PgdA/CDA1 family)
MNPEERAVYLTFDDGPVPGPTEFVLDVLRQFGISAVFFSIGENITRYPEVFGRILAEGHSVGNHTHRHRNGWKSSTGEYLDDIRECERELQQQGVATRLFRPPFGRITRNQIRELEGYRIVMWDVLTQDYNRRLSTESCLNNSLRAVRPGSIVVFHDSYKAENNLRFALPRFVESCLREGYVFRTIDS